jgi:hypothetical protein
VDESPCVIFSADYYYGTSMAITGLKILEDAHEYLAVYNFTSDRDFAYLAGSALDPNVPSYNRNKYDFVS